MQITLTNMQILEHLEVIDCHLQMQYREFDPSSFENRSIDELAQAMMAHVGLYDYEAIIEYDRLDAHTGGYVQLNNNPDKKVHITLSDDLRISRESKWATLAHEVCHKLLYTHDCYFPNMGDYNEVLTDLATIYVGFGKLTLNGCVVISKNLNTIYDLENNPQQHIVTSTSHTGYLSIEQYAMAYRLVCHVNQIERTDYEAGLDAEAMPIIRNNSKIKEIEAKLMEMPELLRNYRLQMFANDAATMREIVLMEAALTQIKKEILLNQKAEIEELGLVDAKNGEIINPYKVLSKALQPSNQDADYRPSLSERMKIILADAKIQDSTLNISCPVCGYSKDKALKEHKQTLIRCPKCGRVFYWDASVKMTAEEQKKKKSENRSKKKESWLSRFFSSIIM